jgi:Cu(I)/Ag(I) efflux system membrane fusion protein
MNTRARLTTAIFLLAALAVAFLAGRCGQQSSKPTGEVVVVETDVDQTYTCSMHPQVRSPNKDAKCPICFMDLIPVDPSSEGLSEAAVMLKEAAVKRAEIDTTMAVRRNPVKTMNLVGTIEADETRSATITAWFPGRIEELMIDYTGASVTAGQPVAKLYSPELLAAQGELQQAARSVTRIKGDSIVARTARATLVSARRKMARWGLSDAQINELETSDEPTDVITIASPIDGVVVERLVDSGEYVTVGQPLLRIDDLDEVWVQLAAHESELPLLKLGQVVDLTADALPGKHFTGTIDFIDPVLDPKMRTANVRVTLDNADGQFRPGMFTRGGISVALGDMAEPPIVVPASSVLLTGRRAVIYVQVPGAEPIFEGREVTLGPRSDAGYIVLEGIEAGESVVTAGAFKIDSELQIKAKRSMMSLTDETTQMRLDVSEAFIESLNPLYGAYFKAQEALADDDFKEFKYAASDIAFAVELAESTPLRGKARNAWHTYSHALMDSAAAADQASDIITARSHFEAMSKAVLQFEYAFGHGSGQAFEMYCPMAFDFKGAAWLQREPNLANPYFGAEMLRCGTTEAIFEPAKDAAQ